MNAICEIVNAPSREAALEAALKDVRAWVEHWNEDRICGLPVTCGSVLDCLATIDAALAKRDATNAKAP